MAARKTRKLRTAVAEDAFGAPPAARGGMMKVAGAEDQLGPGEELLTDDGEAKAVQHSAPAAGPTEGDDTVTKGPVYPESRTLRTTVGALKLWIARSALR